METRNLIGGTWLAERKTREWSRAVGVDVRQLLQELETEFGEELMLRWPCG